MSTVITVIQWVSLALVFGAVPMYALVASRVAARSAQRKAENEDLWASGMPSQPSARIVHIHTLPRSGGKLALSPGEAAKRVRSELPRARHVVAKL
jgi:hypothetical protein